MTVSKDSILTQSSQVAKILTLSTSEGYGVSHNRTYAASGPKWEESRFTATSREPLVLKVSLRY